MSRAELFEAAAVASAVADFAGVEGGFAPDKSLAKYHAASGLNDLFYEEMVVRAKTWCAQKANK